ncbi:TPA: hypothetical protein EYP66_11220 [Candidatus Poribacteria bacterium]|nr:hypothetical protein [Candidatus Poribacteria bacterium]
MLAGEGYWRSSVNRSYYAAYCAVTSVLVARSVRFARGWNNPTQFDYPQSGSPAKRPTASQEVYSYPSPSAGRCRL